MILAINFDKLIIKETGLKIYKYIEEILLLREKLQLSGLGTLKIALLEAGVRGGKFSPPESNLVFSNDESIEEEGYLTRAISEGENISDEEARQLILEFIDDIKFAFNKGEEYKIEGICTLFLDEDSNIDVKKDPDFIIDPDSFGLESFDLDHPRAGYKEEAPEVEKPKQDQKSEKLILKLDVDQDMHKFEETYIRSKQEKPEKEEIPVEPPEAPPPTPPPPTREPVYESEYESKSNRKTIWIILGALVVVIVAVILIPLKTDFLDDNEGVGDIFGDSEEMTVDDDFSDIQDDDFNFDEMVDEMDEGGESETNLEDASKPEESVQVPVSEETTTGKPAEYIEYHIIAGSFKDYENAQELQQQLTLLGYPSLIIEPSPGIYRVSAVSYRDKVMALNRLVEFREKTGLSTAWLMNLE